MSLPPFPVNTPTLLALKGALLFHFDEDGNPKGEFSMSRLLDWMSGQMDIEGIEVLPGLEFFEAPLYCRDDVIDALVDEVLRLREAPCARCGVKSAESSAQDPSAEPASDLNRSTTTPTLPSLEGIGPTTKES